MEIRHILFKEIWFLISLNNQAKQLSIKQLLFEKEKSDNNFSPPWRVCLISILQKFSYTSAATSYLRQFEVPG